MSEGCQTVRGEVEDSAIQAQVIKSSMRGAGDEPVAVVAEAAQYFLVPLCLGAGDNPPPNVHRAVCCQSQEHVSRGVAIRTYREPHFGARVGCKETQLVGRGKLRGRRPLSGRSRGGAPHGPQEWSTGRRRADTSAPTRIPLPRAHRSST